MLGSVVVTVAVRAGPDNVRFPEHYAKGVRYTTVDRADIKQYRELFITRFALDQVKAALAAETATR